MEEVSLTKEERNRKIYSSKDMEEFGKKQQKEMATIVSRLKDEEMNARVDRRVKSREEALDKKTNEFLTEIKKETEIMRVTHQAELMTLETMEKTVADLATIHKSLDKAVDAMTRLTILLEKQTTKTSRAVV